MPAEQPSQSEIEKFVLYSFKPNFRMDGRDIELFEAPKILGDVFESLMGAIFIDGGIEKVIEVYQHLLAPFILYIAKYSKVVRKEPKEEFYIVSNQKRIRPKLECDEQVYKTRSELARLMNGEELPKQPVEGAPSTAEESKMGQEEEEKTKMVKCTVYYNNNEVLVEGYGNTKKQAERNASVLGLKKIQTLL